MSSELYNTRIINRGINQYGESVLLIQTTTSPEEETITKYLFRKNLVRQGRIYQPIDRLSKIAQITAILCIVTGISGCQLPNPFQSEVNALRDQIDLGGGLLLISLLTSSIIEKHKAKWESRMSAFNRNFPNEKISLVPERFHPRRLFGRYQ